jgi:hypothetical protein
MRIHEAIQELQKQALQLPISDRASVGANSFRVAKTGNSPNVATEKPVSASRDCKKFGGSR